jgi:hypothetical protein
MNGSGHMKQTQYLMPQELPQAGDVKHHSLTHGLVGPLTPLPKKNLPHVLSPMQHVFLHKKYFAHLVLQQPPKAWATEHPF